MLADIATNNTGTADVLFLIAAIVFGLATIAAVAAAVGSAAAVPPGNPPGNPHTAAAAGSWLSALVCAGLCLLAIALLLL